MSQVVARGNARGNALRQAASRPVHPFERLQRLRGGVPSRNGVSARKAAPLDAFIIDEIKRREEQRRRDEQRAPPPLPPERLPERLPPTPTPSDRGVVIIDINGEDAPAPEKKRGYPEVVIQF